MHNTELPDDPGSGSSGSDEPNTTPQGTQNSGTVILDAAYAPQNISNLQDVSLLNGARENLEKMIDRE